MDDDYREPVDIRKFCRALEQAWNLVPEAQLGELLETVFNGYSLDELSNEDMVDMLHEYIHQNE